MLRRQRADRRDAFGDRLGDLVRVTAGPDTGGVDAAAAAVGHDAVDQQVEIVLPAIDEIVADQNFRESGPVHLHPRVAAMLIDRRLAAEHQAAAAGLEHRRADIVLSRVDGNRLARDAGGEQRFGDAVRRPWLLRTRLQHQPELQRDDRQPEGVNAGRI